MSTDENDIVILLDAHGELANCDMSRRAAAEITSLRAELAKADLRYMAAEQQLAEARAEVENLRHYAGSEMFMSDFRTAGEMRSAYTEARAECDRLKMERDEARIARDFAEHAAETRGAECARLRTALEHERKLASKEVEFFKDRIDSGEQHLRPFASQSWQRERRIAKALAPATPGNRDTDHTERGGLPEVTGNTRSPSVDYGRAAALRSAQRDSARLDLLDSLRENVVHRTGDDARELAGRRAGCISSAERSRASATVAGENPSCPQSAQSKISAKS